MRWINLAQDRNHWRALVKTVIIGFHKTLESSRVAAQLAASQGGLSSMILVSSDVLLP
jgi:hypothetical protein